MIDACLSTGSQPLLLFDVITIIRTTLVHVI